MSYINTIKMLQNAKGGGYALGAFNVENMETMQAAVLSAEIMNVPLIIQTTGGSVKYAGADYFAAMAKTAALKAKIDIALHMDHGNFDHCIAAIEAGYSSVMIDGSKLPLEENIKVTKKVISVAKKAGVSVEAELGKLGGKEDDIESSTSSYTDPLEAEYFVKATGVDSLAIAVGTAHGVYAVRPVLNTSLITKIRDIISVPLVLHGASGLSDGDIKTCIRNGICKVNFATELRQAFTAAVRGYLRSNPACIDPKEYLSKARAAVTTQVSERIKIMRGN